jgi:hypothetical protein
VNKAAIAHRQLRCVLWFSEASIITIAAVTAVQIATEQHGSIWACGPVAIIAAMETMRVPLAGWAAHLRPLAMLGAFIVMGAISVLTFEGMSIAVERFMHQRVIEVVDAREALDAAKLKLDEEAAADTRYKADFDRMTEEIGKRRKLVSDLEGQLPASVAVPPVTQCKGLYKGKPVTYACKNPAADVTAQADADAMHAHDKAVHDAQDSLSEVEGQLKALQKPIHAQDNAVAVANAQKALEKAASESTMYRTAAAWFGTPVKDLTAEQFERFKRMAVIGVAGGAAVATMLVSFISHAIPRDRGGSKLIRAIRAYFARKRKNVVRTVFETIEKPVEKIVEVEKHVVVDRPIVVEKTVEKPVEKVVVKHIHVPVDINTHRIINRDGSLGDEVGLRSVKGGKQ